MQHLEGRRRVTGNLKFWPAYIPLVVGFALSLAIIFEWPLPGVHRHDEESRVQGPLNPPHAVGAATPELRKYYEAKRLEMARLAAQMRGKIRPLLDEGDELVAEMVDDHEQWKGSKTYDHYRDRMNDWKRRCDEAGGDLARSILEARSGSMFGVPAFGMQIIRRSLEDSKQLIDRMGPWLGLLRDLERAEADQS
jgi:hypothetical protein